MLFCTVFKILLLAFFCWTGIRASDLLKRKHSYIIVCIFITGVLLTLVDVFFRTLLAVGIYLLFKLNFFLLYFYPCKGWNANNDKIFD